MFKYISNDIFQLTLVDTIKNFSVKINKNFYSIEYNCFLVILYNILLIFQSKHVKSLYFVYNFY